MNGSESKHRRVWNTNRLLWFGEILRERFGPHFRVEDNQHGLRVSVEGQLASVCFPTLSALHTCNLIQACSWWNPADEGFASPLGRPLPMPGMEEAPARMVVRCGNEIRFGYDVPGFACWMLSRQEELMPAEVDIHGRFPAFASHASRNGYLDRPVVDEWFELLRQVFQRAWPTLLLVQRQFDIKVSHDVDLVSYFRFSRFVDFARSSLRACYEQGSPRVGFEALKSRLSGRDVLSKDDPANTFDWLMELSERHGIKSAFFFLCGRTSSLDALYEPHHPLIANLIKKIRLRGHEVGLHASYGSYLSQEVLSAEMAALKAICESGGVEQLDYGCRMHFLRWKTPETANGLAAAGVAYDSSLTYAETPGFRCGTCVEYPAYDPLAEKSIERLRIRPLVVMERSVISEHYLGLGLGRAALDVMLRYKSACRSVGGTFTLLWHNTSLRTEEARLLYETVLSA
jgi:hypothetical protein